MNETLLSVKPDALTAAEISTILARHLDWQVNRLLPNCCHTGWESDLLLLRKSGWLEEFEIKVTKADLRRELVEKADKHELLQRGKPTLHYEPPAYQQRKDCSEPKQHTIHRFWFVMPIALAESLSGEIPMHCGLLAVERGGWAGRVTELRKAPVLKMARKPTDREVIDILESAYFRFWRMRLERR